MKKYKNLVPLLLIVLMVVSSYMLVTEANQKAEQYKNYLAEARSYAEQGIVVDAVSAYNNVLELNNSLDICLEVGVMFKENNLSGDLVSWAEYIVDLYPQNIVAYEFLLNTYYEQEDYSSCFTLKDTINKRKLSSSVLTQIFDEIKYTYDLGYKAYENVTVFSEGYCAVSKSDNWGFVNETGNLVIKQKFAEVGAFAGQRAAVKDDEGNYYYIDIKGNKKSVLPDNIKCSALGLIINNTISICNDGKYGFYDSSYDYLFGSYDYASTLNYGIAAIKEGENWYLTDSTGTKINSESYQDIIVDEKEIAFRNERAFVNNGSGYIMVDAKGNKIGEYIYEDAKMFLSDSCAAVKIDGKWGFVNKDGKLLIDPQYDDARSFSNGFAAVCQGEEWGYINENGDIAIEIQYEGGMDFNSSGCAFIKQNNEWVILKLYSYNY